ncbi:kinase-like protein [Ramicandelaber brevisporus]|nr:kinase-like protein [Ramicandelaber brevisporus]
MNAGHTEADDKLGTTRLQQRVVTDELRTLLMSTCGNISRLRDVRPPECHEHPRDYDDYSSNDVGCTISQRARTFSGHSVVVVAKVFATHSGGSDEPAIIAGLQDCKYVVQLVRSRVLDGHNYVMLLEWLDTEFHKSPHQQTLEGATKCAQQLLAGLVFFAERGLVHMDIKPSNIGWSHTRQCWTIFDFSVARYGRAGDGRHNSSDRCGTTRYMAPEVEQPEDYDGWCDCRADVYSLGMSLQVMFNSVTDTAAAHSHHLLVNAVQLMCEQYRDQRRTAAEILRILDR